MKSIFRPAIATLLLAAFLVLTVSWPSRAQLSTSGGAAVNINQVGGNSAATGNGATNTGTQRVTISNDSTGQVTLAAGSASIGSISNTGFNVTGSLPAGSAVIGHVINDSGSTTAVTALPALAAGTNNIGLVRAIPSSCTQSSNFSSATSQVATSTGTTVTSATTCVTFAYANNITNSAVTLRLADKAGTPVIWLGGNADFTIPANSNIRIPIDGVTFTSGITAIAGTASAINLQINGLQ